MDSSDANVRSLVRALHGCQQGQGGLYFWPAGRAEGGRGPLGMTADEAATVVRILLDADGGCVVCAKRLCLAFATAFPAHADLAAALYTNAHPGLALSDKDP